jgi:pimeloyl-ACP methyl ester carboxylesterase
MRVELIDRRRVAVHTVAEGGRGTVVWCHGAPGAGNFDPDPAATGSRGVTLIGVDRPGYGGSEPVRAGEWCTVGRAADDLAEVLRRRGDGPVGVAGWSSGGRVALALAARHPGLVGRLAVVATPAPDEFVPWLAPGLRAQLGTLRKMAPEDAYGKLTVPGEGAQVMRMLAEGGADAGERLAAMFDAAYAQGPIGMLADTAGALIMPWGFEPGQVRAETLLLYGGADPLVAPSHGEWWQMHLPDARYELVPAAGHLVIMSMWGRVLDHLAGS